MYLSAWKNNNSNLRNPNYSHILSFIVIVAKQTLLNSKLRAPQLQQTTLLYKQHKAICSRTDIPKQQDFFNQTKHWANYQIRPFLFFLFYTDTSSIISSSVWDQLPQYYDFFFNATKPDNTKVWFTHFYDILVSSLKFKIWMIWQKNPQLWDAQE